MQDNGTSRGSDLTGGLWEDIYGADGFTLNSEQMMKTNFMWNGRMAALKL